MLRNFQAGLVALVLTVLPVLPACKVTQLSPETQAAVHQLDDEAAVARAEGDEVTAQAKEAQANQLIVDEVQGDVSLLTTALSVIPGVGPLLAQVPGELLLIAAPLLFKRPRKHLAKAGKDAVDGVLKASGLKHSSDATEALTDQEA